MIAEFLLRNRFVAGVVFAPSHDPRTPPAGIALASHDEAQVFHFADAQTLSVLKHHAQRHNTVFFFDDALSSLQRLLHVGVDVARPMCRSTLQKLLRDSYAESVASCVDGEQARVRAQQLIAQSSEFIAEIERGKLKKVARLEALVLRVFASLTYRGLHVDTAQWRALITENAVLAKTAFDEVVTLGGNHVERDLFQTPLLNLDADADVRTLLERVLSLKLEDTQRSTLQAIDHPLTRALVRYREAQKVVSTYGEAFLSHVDAKTSRVHSTFIPIGASTGRVASRDPNLQNLPSDARFHQALNAPSGRKMITADYATCELRIVAELALDPVFLRAFDEGVDLHSTVATTMFKQKVTKTENAHLRQRAKAINFGLVYGMGAQALAMSLGVSQDEGEKLLGQYFETFPRIRDYLESSVDTALKQGYASTILGRRLVFDTEVLKGKNARGELSRIAKNMPIQGTSADMTKLAMVRVHERLVDEGRDAFLVNTIHDELLVESDAEIADAVAEIVREEMGQAHMTLLKRVPPLVEVHVADFWNH